MTLWIAAALFITFVANIISGAMGDGPFLDDVAEMLLLGAASVFFVADILKREAAVQRRTHED